jgi:nitrous oxidase accessory protein NosD
VRILRGGRAAATIWTALALAAILAVSSRWLEKIRPVSPERAAGNVFHVTSGEDAGPGSLRESIFAADRTAGRARIVIDVPRIVLGTPLPPLVNPAGIVIAAARRHAVLDASALTGGPVLDLAAPDCVIIGLRIERALDQAILVRKGGARLRDVAITDSGVGVHQLDGANDLVVNDSTFARNVVGVHVAAGGAPVKLLDNQFQHHRRAAIWAVASTTPPPQQPNGLDIARNRFNADAQSVVLYNTQGRVEANVFENATDAAVHVTGTRVVIKGNRMRAGRAFGVRAERIQHGVISNNEIDHNCSGGVIVRDSHDTEVTFNRIYSNGFGMILVSGRSVSPNTVADNLVTQQAEDGLYVIGGSPVIRQNRLLQNRKAGLRLSSLPARDRQRTPPQPLLDANVLNGNGTDDVLRDEYEPRDEIRLPEPADCAWRLGGGPIQVATLGGRN